VREMAGVLAGQIGVVVGEVGADQLAVHPLEVEVGPPVGLVDDQSKSPAFIPNGWNQAFSIVYGPSSDSAVSTELLCVSPSPMIFSQHTYCAVAAL
jgi:hypothetical protein